MPLLIWVVPPAMVSERDDRRRSTHRWLVMFGAEHVERQRGEVLAQLRPHALGQAGRPERVTAVQRRRDRPLAQQLEVVDPHRDVAEPAQRRAVLERRPAVDDVVGQVGDEVGQLDLHLRVQPRGTRPFVAQRRGGDLPSPVERAEQRVGGHPHVVEEHLREVGGSVQGDQRASLDAGQPHIDDQAGDALVLGGVGVGAHVELTPER